MEADEFRGELVRRFFNPKSYFFLCLSTRLQEIHDSHSRLDDDDYLLIGALLDRLVQADDKFKELQALSEIKGFEGFCTYLGENVSRLRNPQLPQDQMKYTIESVAGTLAEMLASAVHDRDSRGKLEKHLGIEITAQGSIPDAMPWVVDEALSEPLLNEVRAGLKAFAEAIHGTLHPEKITSALEGLRVSAMIYGDDEIETIAEKTLQFISSARQLPALDQTLLVRSKEFIERLLRDGKRDGIQAEVRAHVTALSVATKATQEQAPHAMPRRRGKGIPASEPLNAPRAEDQGPVTQPPEAVLPLGKVTEEPPKSVAEPATKQVEPEIVLVEDQQVVQKATAPPSEWKIPGEDDEELLSLIEEVTRAQQKVRGKTDQEILLSDIGESEPTESVDLLERLPGEAPVDRRKQSFCEEASLHIKVLNDALGTLATEPERRSAWEDVELAAHSLKSVAERLGLDALAQVPALMESLATRSFLRGSRASAAQMIPVLQRGVDFLKGLPRDEADQPEYLEKLIKELKQLAVPVDRPPTPIVDQSPSPERGRFSLRPAALFRLRRREGDRSHYSLDRPRSAEEAS